MNKKKKEAKIITVTSTKGGTGKTFMSISLAGIYSNIGYKTLIIDTDLASGGVSLSLNAGIKKDIYVLSEDIKNNKFDKLEDYIYKYNKNLFVLPSPIDPRKNSKFSSSYLALVMTKAKEEFDVIIMDTNHILDDINITALDMATKNLFIVSSDMVCIKNLKSIVSIFKDLKHDNYKILLTDYLYKSIHKLKKKDIVGIIDEDINYTVNNMYIKNYDNYVIKGKIPILDKKNKKLYKQLLVVANNLLEQKES